MVAQETAERNDRANEPEAADRCDRNRILCTSAWTKDQAEAIGNAS